MSTSTSTSTTDDFTAEECYDIAIASQEAAAETFVKHKVNAQIKAARARGEFNIRYGILVESQIDMKLVMALLNSRGFKSNLSPASQYLEVSWANAKRAAPSLEMQVSKLRRLNDGLVARCVDESTGVIPDISKLIAGYVDSDVDPKGEKKNTAITVT